jgi:hypothetical protein
LVTFPIFCEGSCLIDVVFQYSDVQLCVMWYVFTFSDQCCDVRYDFA